MVGKVLSALLFLDQEVCGDGVFWFPLSGQVWFLRWDGDESAQHCMEFVVTHGVHSHETHWITHLTNTFCLPDSSISPSFRGGKI